MFLRINEDQLVNLEDLSIAEIFRAPEPGEPYLLLTMKSGAQLFIGESQLHPDIAMGMILMALTVGGELFGNKDAETVKVQLDEDEEEALSDAMEKGYEWIARDKNQTVYAYRHRPVRRSAEWFDEEVNSIAPLRLKSDMFCELTFENGPLNIKAILLGV